LKELQCGTVKVHSDFLIFFPCSAGGKFTKILPSLQTKLLQILPAPPHHPPPKKKEIIKLMKYIQDKGRKEDFRQKAEDKFNN